jgi:myo-inositol-hexaphosphate 3-phosphohydrolase
MSAPLMSAPEYADGLMVAQDSENVPTQNFKLMSWNRLKSALRLK